MRRHGRLRLPATATRVEFNTSEAVNTRIREETRRRVASYRGADPDRIRLRLAELDREWDVERTVEANAAVFALAGLALGKAVSRRWYLLPALAVSFLLQHALQGWSPPMEWARRLGVRTYREIEEERRALEELLER